MNKLAAIVSGVLAILVVVLLAQGWGSKRSSKRQLQAVESERDRLAKDSAKLNQQLSELEAQRKGDRALIGQLFGLVHEGGSASGFKPTGGKSQDYDIAALKALAKETGGDLNKVINQILTADRLKDTLQRHAEQPAYWVAAASMCGDPAQALQYLEDAAARFPQSVLAQASLIEAKRDMPQADAATRAAIDNLRKADPTSSLADHYDAYFRLKAGDVERGLQALAAASEKDRFADQRLELMMSRYEVLLENGCSDGGALALSAFSLPFSHLSMLREVGQQALERAQTAYAAGQVEQALQTADYVARIGRNLSASGRFIVYDRVGMELQAAALEAERRFHTSAGNAYQVGELEYQLGAIQARSARVNAMAEAFGGILANMTDDSIVRYIESALMHGEFSTLQGLIPTP